VHKGRVASVSVLFLVVSAAAAFLGQSRLTIAHANDFEAAAHGCGVERWDVKTLADAAGIRLHPAATGTSRTISALAQLPVVTGANGSRGVGTERREFTIHNVILVEAKVEADSDIHLVVADPAVPSTTMIVEFPLSTCLPVKSSLHTPAQNTQIGKDRALEKAARDAFVAACGTPSPTRFTHFPAGARGTISGIGFFDVQHGQTGVAANAIELHPVVFFSGHC
jgi:hypothetical protein